MDNLSTHTLNANTSLSQKSNTKPFYCFQCSKTFSTKRKFKESYKDYSSEDQTVNVHIITVRNLILTKTALKFINEHILELSHLNVWYVERGSTKREI